MSTQIKRLYQNNQEFVPITLTEAVVVNTTNIPGLQSLGITTLDKVLKTTLGVVGSNTLNIDTINRTLATINNTLQNKQDKLTAGDGITITPDGTISVTNTSTLGFQYKIVSTLPSPPNKDHENIIYLVPNSNGVNGNIFTEYICINKDSNYIWEQIGSLTTDVNLDDYVTKTEFNTLQSTVLTAQNVTTSSGTIVTVNYDIPSTLYDE